MSIKDMRQGRDYSTGNLAVELRKTAIYHGPREYAIMHAAADRLEELERELERLNRLDDYDQKRHSGLLEE